jgi:hypothetical protein
VLTLLKQRTAEVAFIMITTITLMAACSNAPNGTVTSVPKQQNTPSTGPDWEGTTGVISKLPPESRTSTGGGDPRSAEYWITWSTCSVNNRSAQAAANGGAEEGWYLVDDFLQTPGMGIGNHSIPSCDEAISILSSRENAFEELAALLFAADLNRNAGSEHCEAADQSMRAAHLALAGLGYQGPMTINTEPGAAIFQLIDLLSAYNAGSLCR